MSERRSCCYYKFGRLPVRRNVGRHEIFRQKGGSILGEEKFGEIRSLTSTRTGLNGAFSKVFGTFFLGGCPLFEHTETRGGNSLSIGPSDNVYNVPLVAAAAEPLRKWGYWQSASLAMEWKVFTGAKEGRKDKTLEAVGRPSSSCNETYFPWQCECSGTSSGKIINYVGLGAFFICKNWSTGNCQRQ